jgi:2,5-diketo-D-gluconate reductase A
MTMSETTSRTRSVPGITLNDGHTIPQLGFGVFQVAPEETADVTLTALEAGYRHIDTAEMYGNERGVGQAVARSGLSRSEVFITSKLNNGFHRPPDARAAMRDTLDALGSEYVDLFLIHWPLPTRYDGDFVSTWKVLEEFRADGLARSIGVSNFQPHHIDRLLAETDTAPAVNQVEVHPYLTQEEVRRYDGDHGIATEAWSPIAQGKVLDDPVVADVARKFGKSPAQVVLRWHLQRGDIVFPKSVTPRRIRENFAVFDFGLEPDDMDAISALNRDERTGPDPDTFDHIPTERRPGRGGQTAARASTTRRIPSRQPTRQGPVSPIRRVGSEIMPGWDPGISTTSTWAGRPVSAPSSAAHSWMVTTSSPPQLTMVAGTVAAASSGSTWALMSSWKMGEYGHGSWRAITGPPARMASRW